MSFPILSIYIFILFSNRQCQSHAFNKLHVLLHDIARARVCAVKRVRAN